MNRRSFLKRSAVFAAGTGIVGASAKANAFTARPEQLYDISLAQWSLHRALFQGQMKHMDFATTAMEKFGVSAVEYVNQFFKDKAEDTAYLTEMKDRAESAGVTNVLIMCDGEGRLGDPDDELRTEAVENHYKWVEAAKFLGCHSIRVNAASVGSFDEQMKLAADGLRRLSEFADQHEINVLVENHGGFSSHGQWLASVMELADHPRCGTLPDFGNFRIQGDESYDRYQGVAELMPYAKAVSAKSNDFDEEGNETSTDFSRMMRIVLDAGYRGFVGIEYEGRVTSEEDGILATKRLLERVREELASEYL